MEKFTFLNKFNITNKSATLEFADGFITMDGGQGAYGSVSEIAGKIKWGWLVSATALVIIRDDRKEKLLLIKRTDDAKIEPGLWQAPAGRLELNELPLDCAKRELLEEFGIKGFINNWHDLMIFIGGKEVECQFKNIIHTIKARLVFVEHIKTVEFYYPMVLDLSILNLNESQISFFDNECYNREIKLFDKDEVLNLLMEEKLTKPFAEIVKQEFLNFDSNFRFKNF